MTFPSMAQNIQARWPKGNNENWPDRFKSVAEKLGVGQSIILRQLVEGWVVRAEQAPDIVSETIKATAQTVKKLKKTM